MSAIRPRSRIGIVLAALTALALAIAGPASAHGDGKGADVYKKRNLVSDIDGVARITDANLVNPWGLAVGPATPAVGLRQRHGRLDAVLRRRAREHPAVILPLVVGIPGGAPTGVVFNRHRRLQGRAASPAGHFIFDSEAGTITAWKLGHAGRDRGDDARRGLQGPGHREQGQRDDALRRRTSTTGKIDVFNDAFAPVTVPGGVRRPEPAGRLRAVQRPGDRRAPGRRLRPAGPPIPHDERRTARASATSTSSTRAATCCGG